MCKWKMQGLRTFYCVSATGDDHSLNSNFSKVPYDLKKNIHIHIPTIYISVQGGNVVRRFCKEKKNS